MRDGGPAAILMVAQDDSVEIVDECACLTAAIL
jgi:hypothetical protein